HIKAGLSFCALVHHRMRSTSRGFNIFTADADRTVTMSDELEQARIIGRHGLSIHRDSNSNQPIPAIANRQGVVPTDPPIAVRIRADKVRPKKRMVFSVRTVRSLRGGSLQKSSKPAGGELRCGHA